MKLGTETASLVNHLMSGTNGQPEPEVGMGLTFLAWTDRRPGTVCGVAKMAGRTVMFTARTDKAIRTDTNVMSDAQSYRFEPDPSATLLTFRKDRKGNWRLSYRQDGRWRFLEKHQSIHLGARSCYHDYSF